MKNNAYKKNVVKNFKTNFIPKKVLIKARNCRIHQASKIAVRVWIG